MDRKLATIFASDVVGFSKMMGIDEVKTLEILKQRRDVIDKIIDDHDGLIFGSAGDSVIAEFASPIKAAEAAVETQVKMKTMNHGKEDSDKMTFRVGINIGDVMVTDNNLFGDAVNIAARLEAAAKPSGICVSQTVFDMINRKIMVSFEDAGQLELKNIDFPIKAFHVLENKGTPRFTQDSNEIQNEIKDAEPGSVAVMMFKNLSNDEEQEYFCEGFCEDLLSMLSRYNKLVVISSHASFAYRDKNKNFKEIGKELGVRYIINGSVRKLGNRMRINCQLLSIKSDETLWSNNFDLLVDEVFDVQDQIAEEIVSTIVGRVESDVLESIKSKRPEKMGAYELVLKGLDYARKGNVIKENTENAADNQNSPNEIDAEKTLGAAVETKIEAQKEAVKSQNTIDQLTDETRDIVQEYRNAIRKTDSLNSYNQQLAKLVKQQKISLSSIQRQLENAEETKRSIVPFINKMIATLEKFVRLDLPFLLDERRQRIATLKQIVNLPDITLPDKYRPPDIISRD